MKELIILGSIILVLIVLAPMPSMAVIERYSDMTEAEYAAVKARAVEEGFRFEVTEDRRCGVLLTEAETFTDPPVSRSIPLSTTPGWMSAQEYAVGGMRWLDVDDDGDLDLVTVHYEGGYPARPEETRVWMNSGNMLETSASWVSTDQVWSTDTAVGDIDQNGYPDIAMVTINGNSTVIYFQDDQGLETTPSWQSSEAWFALYASLGNITGNVYLDMALVNQGTYTDPNKPNYMYANSTGTPATSASWTSSDIAQNMACALGDYDEDGLSDTVFTFSGDGSRHVFRIPVVPIHQILSVTVDDVPVTDYNAHLRDGWVVFMTPPGTGVDNIEITATVSVDLDFAVAVDHGNAKVYHDLGSTYEATPSFTVSGTGDRREKTANWADVDNDGDLDLFIGGRGVPSMLYLNMEGVLNTTASWSSLDSAPDASDSDWIDVDNDGDLDVAFGSTGDSDNDLVWVHENNSGVLETDPGWKIPWSAVGSMCNCVAWGDMNGDGWPDLAAGFAGSNIRVFLNTGSGATPTHTPTARPSDTPTTAPTDTCTPTVSDTPTASDTPTPTGTITPTPSPTVTLGYPSFTPTPLHSPTPPPSITPSPTITPPPTSTPTPLPDTCSPTPFPATGMVLTLDNEYLTAGDMFHLYYFLYNPGDSSYFADVYLLLDVYGSFWCYPSWISLQNGLDYKQAIPVSAGDMYYEDVLNFIWPDTVGEAGNLKFYGASFMAGSWQLIGDVQIITWGYY